MLDVCAMHQFGLAVSAPQIETISARKNRSPRGAGLRGHTSAAAGDIDGAAKRARVSVLPGTGVNCFVMEALPVTMTGVCERWTGQHQTIQDAVSGGAFQTEDRVGLTRERSQSGCNNDGRHVGLTESSR